MAKKYDFITLGGAVEDIAFQTDEAVMIDNRADIKRQKLLAFEYGAKFRIDKSFASFGGGASNAAVCFSRLGFRTVVAASVGDDHRGQDIIDNFNKHNVATELIQVQKGLGTGFTFFVIGKDKEHVGFTYRGANDRFQVKPELLDALKESSWLYAASLSGKWQTVLKKVFAVPGLRVAWNPGQSQLRAGLKALAPYLLRTAVLTLNQDEAIELAMSEAKVGQDPKFFRNVRNLLRLLGEKGPRIVVITSGSQGVDAYDGRKFYRQDARIVSNPKDATGVGDAFGSTFVAGLELTGGDIARSLAMGTRNAAAVVSKPWAQNGLLARSGILKASA